MNANVEGAIEKQEEQRKEILNNQTLQALFATIDDFAPDGESGEEIFATLIDMPDDQFNVIAPVFIEEMQKAFNEPAAQLSLANIINAQGAKYEDVVKAYEDLIKDLDETLPDDVLSPAKKDLFRVMLDSIVNAIGETQMVTKRIVEIPIQKSENGKIPTYAHISDAAMDIYSAEEYEIGPGEQVMIKTGIKVAIPYGYAILIQPRSGLSSKTKLRICNTPGLIDSGYRGEICVLMENVEPKIKDLEINQYGAATGVLYGSSYHIDKGERIAQMRLVEVPTINFSEVATILDFESDRGEGGFGSTGNK